MSISILELAEIETMRNSARKAIADGIADAEFYYSRADKATTQEERDKADAAIQPVILISVKNVGYFRFRTPDEPEYLRPTTHDLKRAIKFNSMNEVQNYLGECPTGNIIVTYHHPKTLELMPNPKEPTPF